MPGDVDVLRVDRDRILGLRTRALGDSALSGDRAVATRHWAAVVDGEAVGCASVMRVRGWALRGVAVAAEHRRRGIGTRLVQVACAEVGAQMWCNARIDAVPFYRAVGWSAVGPIFELGERGRHQRLTWTP